jgi:hypothetical protein
MVDLVAGEIEGVLEFGATGSWVLLWEQIASGHLFAVYQL